MKSRLFRFLNILILAGLVACSSIVPSPTPTATLTATFTSVPTATQTLTPTITPTPTPALPEGLRPLQEKLGNISFTENPGGYYEAYDFSGKKIENAEFYEDSTVRLWYGSKELWVAYQSVQYIGEDLWVGLSRWDKENRVWDAPQSLTAQEMAKKAEAGDTKGPSLTILKAANGDEAGKEVEYKLTNTVFTVRDLILATYDRAEEFRGITVNSIENFDNTPDRWVYMNYSRSYKGVFSKNGVYSFEPESPYYGVRYKSDGRHKYARPIQPVIKGPGWFNVNLVFPDKQVKSIVHAPVIAANAEDDNGNRSFADISVLVKITDLSQIAPSLTPERRGELDIWLFRETVDQVPPVIFTDSDLLGFTAEVNNRNFFHIIGAIPQDTHKNFMSLPNEVGQAFFTFIIQKWVKLL